MEPRRLSLARIRVYPLKGAGGLDLTQSTPDAFGLPGDRRWMLVDSHGLFISQRTHPRLALLRVKATGDGSSGAPYRVEGPGTGAFLLPKGDGSGEMTEVRLHKDRVRGRIIQEGSTWFSKFLEEDCRLTFIPDEVHRPVDPVFAPGFKTSFSDGYPLLVATEASLEDLNGRLTHRSSMLRFRPNLVIRGAHAWEEDMWRVFEVGGARIGLVKPCARCSVTVVDQDTGVAGKEPLKTLAQFRLWEGKTYFGQNGVFLRNGSFRVGQSVGILEKGDARPPLPVAAL